MARKKTDSVGLRLRFSEVLRRRIERAAAAAQPPRSMNAEIVARLEQSFRREDQEAALGAVAEAAGKAAGKAAVEAGKVNYEESMRQLRQELGLPPKPKGGDK